MDHADSGQDRQMVLCVCVWLRFQSRKATHARVLVSECPLASGISVTTRHLPHHHHHQQQHQTCAP